MANGGTTPNQLQVVQSSISLYFLMMGVLGATIGAIAGLSNTSISNTLIELIASVVAGSAGLYFIDRKSVRQETDVLCRIGLLGLLFMVLFWGAYLGTATYRYDGPAYYKWQKSVSVYRNLALAEIYGHARKLGIADKDIETALADETKKKKDVKTCELLRKDTKKISNLISAVYNSVGSQEDHPELSKPVKYIAKYIGARFEATNNMMSSDDPQKVTDGKQMHSQSVATLMFLIRQHRELVEPARFVCRKDEGTRNCLAARWLQEMLATCRDFQLVEVLMAMRSHAREFESIWDEEVSTEPVKAPYTFETSERNLK